MTWHWNLIKNVKKRKLLRFVFHLNRLTNEFSVGITFRSSKFGILDSKNFGVKLIFFRFDVTVMRYTRLKEHGYGKKDI